MATFVDRWGLLSISKLKRIQNKASRASRAKLERAAIGQEEEEIPFE